MPEAKPRWVQVSISNRFLKKVDRLNQEGNLLKRPGKKNNLPYQQKYCASLRRDCKYDNIRSQYKL